MAVARRSRSHQAIQSIMGKNAVRECRGRIQSECRLWQVSETRLSSFVILPQIRLILLPRIPQYAVERSDQREDRAQCLLTRDIEGYYSRRVEDETQEPVGYPLQVTL